MCDLWMWCLECVHIQLLCGLVHASCISVVIKVLAHTGRPWRYGGEDVEILEYVDAGF